MSTRVLMFGWEYPPFKSGGLGTACAGLARALADEGNEVLFVLPKKLPLQSECGIRFLFADIPDSAHYAPYGNQFSREYNGSLVDKVRQYAQFAREIAARESFDVIHAHDWLSFGAGIEAKRVSGKPLVVHVHATQFDHACGGNVDASLYAMEKEGLEFADIIIAVSNFTKNKIVAHYGIDASKIVVVHNGIEEDAARTEGLKEIVPILEGLRSRGTKVVLFLGRITMMKGPDYFINAAKRVTDIYPKVIFVIAGAGDMERQIISQAAELGIADKVLFAGFVRGEDVSAFFRAADLFVLPSVSEPFGITPLESLLYGNTPVLISRQSGVSEVLNHALKVDFWDVDDMAQKIISVLKHGVLHDTLRDNGRMEARGITWKKAASKIAEIYRGILRVFKKFRRI